MASACSLTSAHNVPGVDSVASLGYLTIVGCSASVGCYTNIHHS